MNNTEPSAPIGLDAALQASQGHHLTIGAAPGTGQSTTGPAPLSVPEHRLYVGGAHLLEVLRARYRHLPQPSQISVRADGDHVIGPGNGPYGFHAMWAVARWAAEFGVEVRLRTTGKLSDLRAAVTLPDGMAVRVETPVFSGDCDAFLWALDHDGAWPADDDPEPACQRAGHGERVIVAETAAEVLAGHPDVIRERTRAGS